MPVFVSKYLLQVTSFVSNKQRISQKSLSKKVITGITSVGMLCASLAANAADNPRNTPFTGKLRTIKSAPVKFKHIGQVLEYKRKLLLEGRDSASAYIKSVAKSYLPTPEQTSSLIFSTASNTSFGEILGSSDGYMSFRLNGSGGLGERAALTNTSFTLSSGVDGIYLKANKNLFSLGAEQGEFGNFFNVSPGNLFLFTDDKIDGLFKVSKSYFSWNDQFLISDHNSIVPYTGPQMSLFGFDYEILNFYQDNYRIGGDPSWPYGITTSLNFGVLGGTFWSRGSDKIKLTDADDIPFFTVDKQSEYTWYSVGGTRDYSLKVKLGDNTTTLPASISTDKIVTIDANGNLHKTNASALTGIPESFSGTLRKFNSDLAIGNITPTDTSFNLFVEKGILTRKITVNPNKWADYVFNTDYKLRSLQDLETFINKNKHLPDVPTAETVAKEGVNLGDNQAVLLKKVEELTLYIIELNKRIQTLEKNNKN